MPTMLTLLRELAKAKRKEEGSAITGTATSGTSTTLVDTTEPELYYSNADANLFDRWFAYNELAGATGRVNRGGLAGSTGILTLTGGEFGAEGTATAAVSTTTAGGTGTLTDTRVSWATNQWVGATFTCNSQTMVVTSNTEQTATSTTDWSADPGDAASWTAFGVCPYILTKDDSPTDLKNAINYVLRHFYVPSFFPLSMHIVGNDANDMEASTVATDYSKSASATLAADTTKVYNGAQSLKVTAGAATQYAYTANIPVNENQALYAAVRNAVDAGDSAEFRIINVDDSNATIENATNDEVTWMELVFQFQVPSGCERLQAWMISTDNTDVSNWDDLQIWRSRGEYQGPSWLVRSSQMIDVRAFPSGTGGPSADNDYRTNERMSYPLNWHIEREDMRGDSPLYLWVNAGGARPYIYALRPLSELTSDSSITPADLDKVIDFALDLILDPERGRKRIADYKTAVLTAPPTRVSPRVGVRIG